MHLENLLSSGINKGNILFCGAGFSSDCLNFSETEIGTASPLHTSLNEALEYNYNDIQVAADEYIEKFGEHGLLNLLGEKYAVKSRSLGIKNLLNYPWRRIYTTNYDDVISQTLTDLGIDHYTVNNTEKLEDVHKFAENQLLVVHLHGSLRKWDINNFSQSCVLGRESYLRISSNSNWIAVLREDYSLSKSVYFVGFSNSDFYLAENLYSAKASREKVFFINSVGSEGDRELIAKQKKYGEPFAIGRDKFSDFVEVAASNRSDDELSLHCYTEFELPTPQEDRASVVQQEDLIVRGRIAGGAHIKDVLDSSSSYRAQRKAVNQANEFLTSEGAVALVVGGICSGKSLILDEVSIMQRISGKTVFLLNRKFHDIVEETKEIVKKYPDCVVVIDDCYSLKTDLEDVLSAVDRSGARLLLGSRSLAHDSAVDIRDMLSSSTPYCVIDVEELDDDECEAFVQVVDRIGVWGTTANSDQQKMRIVKVDNARRMSGNVLSIFRSEHVKKRFISAIELVRARGPDTIDALILALYLSHVGEIVQENALSEMLGLDAVSLLEGDSCKQFIDFDVSRGRFILIASINARESLKGFFDSQMVTSAVIRALTNMAPVRQIGNFRKVFSEFMRYTQLKQVVSTKEEIEWFFDRLSEMEFCRGNFLFWLQWSMAKRDNEEYVKAEQYLEEAYRLGRMWDNFFSDHLDDQKAGLLLDSVKPGMKSSEMLRRHVEAVKLLHTLCSRDKQTSHPYLTIQSLEKFFSVAAVVLSKAHAGVCINGLDNLRKVVMRKYEGQHEGFIRESMRKSMEEIDGKIRICRSIIDA